MKNGVKIGSIALLAVLFAGCAGTRVALQPSFWENKSQKIGILISKCPAGYTYKLGSQGLLDMAINSAMATGLTQFVQSYDYSSFDSIRTDFESRFSERGFSWAPLDDDSLIPKLKQITQNSPVLADLRSATGADCVLFIDIKSCGTAREYYGFIPLGSPKGIFVATGILYNLNTGKTEWKYVQNINKSCVNVDGDWNQPPDYPNMARAIQSSIIKTRSDLISSFFK